MSSDLSKTNSFIDTPKACFFASSIRPLAYYFLIRDAAEIVHDFVSIKTNFSKTCGKRRKMYISLRYSKLFGDSVMEESI